MSDPLRELLRTPPPRDEGAYRATLRRFNRSGLTILVAAAFPLMPVVEHFRGHKQAPIPWVAVLAFLPFSVAIVAYWLSQRATARRLLRDGVLCRGTMTKRLIGARSGSRVRVDFTHEGARHRFNTVVPAPLLASDSTACEVLTIPGRKLAVIVADDRLLMIERFRRA